MFDRLVLCFCQNMVLFFQTQTKLQAEKVIFIIKSFFQDRSPYKVQLPKNFRFSKKGISVRDNKSKFRVFQERAAFKVQWVKLPVP